MKTSFIFKVVVLAIFSSVLIFNSCSKGEEPVPKEEIEEEEEIPESIPEPQIVYEDFADNNWRGIVWEPHNKSWLNNGTLNDAEDIVQGKMKWVRIWLKANNRTDEMDAMVNLCNEKGLKIIACYNKTNPEHELGDDTQQAEQKERLKEWVNRYKSSIHFWEVHNEANLSSFWAPDIYDSSKNPPEVGRGSTDPNSPYNAAVKRYVQWLKIAYETIKEQDSTATVILGGISEWIMEDWMNRFEIEQGYKYIDEVAFHPYASNPDAVVNRLKSFKSKMSKWPNGRNNMPIWITEIGFNVGLSGTGAKVPDEDTKALYLKETYQKIMVNLQWVRPICWYILHEVNPGSNYYNLLVRTNNTDPATLLPAYTTYKNLDDKWVKLNP